MSTGSAKAKSKEVTWSEKDLAKHILRDKKKLPADTDGSLKSSTKAGRSRQPVASGRKSSTSSLSSTMPVSRASAGATRGREKLASTTTAASPLSDRRAVKDSGQERGGREERRGKGETTQRERDRGRSGSLLGSSKSGEKTRSSGGGVATRDQRGVKQGGRQPERSSRDGRRGEGRGQGREGTRDARDSEGTAKRERGREGSRVETRRHGRDSPSREAAGKRAGEEKRVKEPRQGREGGRGQEKKLEAASSTSLRETEPGAPLADAIEDMERELKERQKSKKTGNDGRPPEGATPQPMEEVREEVEEEEDIEYEEGFEEDDYNEDEFEEDIEEESESKSTGSDVVMGKSPLAINPDPSPRINLVEIMQAIDAENRDVGGGEGRKSAENTPPPPLQLEHSASGVDASVSRASVGSVRSQGSMKRRFVDFSSAKKKEEKERVARVTRKRGQELLSMIELDEVAFDLFDLQPLSEYELYMRSFGTEGTRQVACQTGEDNAEAEAQTEEVKMVERWVQWPPEDLRGYGGPMDDDAEQVSVVMAIGGSSAVRLTSFLKRASQVMEVLLEENALPCGQSPLHSNQSQIPFCTSHTQIRSPPQLHGCTLTSVEYSPTHPHLLMTTHMANAESDHVCLDPVPCGGGVVCVWSTREPSLPQYLLACESSPVCGCFSHHKTSIVFSGNDDGSVVLWDLREPVAMHTRPPGATPTTQGLVPRSPTFSTAALPHKHNHHSPIITVSPITISTPHASPLTDSTETETIGLSFQLASLDKSGLLIIWVAVETKPHPQGSESDLGLLPGGRVKLVWSTALDTGGSLSSGSVPVQTLCVRFHPTDTNHLFVGTDEGVIVHQTRYGRPPIPRQYRSQTGSHCPCDITSLSFSPWQPDYFLAGYSNGYIALYHTKKAQPLVTWSESTNGIAVWQVEWAWHQPGMFLVLDAGSNLCMWNLLENDGGPTQMHARGTSSILSFRLSPPLTPSPLPSSPSPHSTPSLALCLSDSSIEIHHLTQAASPSNTTELSETLAQNFINYLQTL